MSFAFQSRRSNVLARNAMVATSQPLAVQAGLQILRAGGNAADAAIATAAMLCVVEPISNGIGGDNFALYFDAATGEVTALNSSGCSGAGSDAKQLRGAGMKAMPLFSGHAVTVPGAVAGWYALADRHGSIPVSELLQPAVDQALTGFPVTEWIAETWKLGEAKLRRDADWDARDPFDHPSQPSGREMLLDGRAPRFGEVMKLPNMAETLRRIAAEGPAYIYRGEFAKQAAAHVQKYHGWLTAADFANHSADWVEPLTCQYRDVVLYECPPNGQGIAASIAASIANTLDLAAMGEVERTHALIECMKLGFGDALQWAVDPSQTDIPVERLLSDEYISQRAASIDMKQAATAIETGLPYAGDDTVYLSVVDGDGNACSFIQSCYMGTGSGLVVPGTGVSLQNRGAGFSLDAGHPNELAPSKRPYHTIIPAMTTREGKLHASFGVMGGSMQPQGHLQMLVNMLDLGMAPQQALDAPRWQIAGLSNYNTKFKPGDVMHEPMPEDLTTGLNSLGHRLTLIEGFEQFHMGGGQIILRDPDSGVLTAGSDPRKDGCAAGF